MPKQEPPSIWLRPEPAERRPRYSRDKIAAAALAIADESGFEAVSMREVASRLGAGTMTLYHYVRTKDDLVALMDDALMAEVLLPEQELKRSWREQLTAIARRTRSIYERHPWALLAMRGAPPGPNGLRHIEQCLGALAETKLDASAKLDLLGMIDDFVFGNSLRVGEAQMNEGSAYEHVVTFEELTERMHIADQFPQSAAVFAAVQRQSEQGRLEAFVGGGARFERGLSALLDAAESGMRSAHKSRPNLKKKKRAANKS